MDQTSVHNFCHKMILIMILHALLNLLFFIFHWTINKLQVFDDRLSLLLCCTIFIYFFSLWKVKGNVEIFLIIKIRAQCSHSYTRWRNYDKIHILYAQTAEGLNRNDDSYLAMHWSNKTVWQIFEGAPLSFAQVFFVFVFNNTKQFI